MAGRYITILNPGYSLLWTRDLAYTVGSGEASDLNPFDPSGDRPLVEGEWLERSGSDKYTRGGNNVVSVSGTPDGEGTSPAFLYFNEQGRTDVQAIRRAHCIIGPAMFEFRTKLCKSAGLSVGSKVSVWDHDMDVSGGTVRRALAALSSGSAYVVGYVTRVFGTDDISVLYCPGHLA